MAGDSGVRAVLFDLDNTLVERDGALMDYCRELYSTREAIYSVCTEAEAMELFVRFDGGGTPSRREFYALVLEQWPGAFASLDEAMEGHQTAFIRHFSLTPAMEGLLRDLKARSVPVGIVTNGTTATQSAKIAQCGLDMLVDAIAISESVGAWKPERAIFEYALDRINADPAGTLFVGDNPEADIVGASSLGMRTAWVHRGREWPLEAPAPDFLVDDASHVRPMIFPSPV